ncbi:hypothetical protein [Streptomyces albidoflavus]|uniref:hypothetical protein n=1 Tax=Streptomyces albidoflavus TaxID=1886 RepID=UPI00332F189A
MTTVHVAGPPQMGGLYQECARCSYVLQDYTGGAIMIPEDQADTGIPTFPEGWRIVISGNAAWAKAEDAELCEHETECRPTS